MSKVVTVEELVANIDAFVDDVKRGETLTLLQDGATVATIAPPENGIRYAHVPPPGVRPSDFTPTLRLNKPLPDAAELIRADRNGEWEKNGV